MKEFNAINRLAQRATDPRLGSYRARGLMRGPRDPAPSAYFDFDF